MQELFLGEENVSHRGSKFITVHVEQMPEVYDFMNFVNSPQSERRAFSKISDGNGDVCIPCVSPVHC